MHHKNTKPQTTLGAAHIHCALQREGSTHSAFPSLSLLSHKMQQDAEVSHHDYWCQWDPRDAGVLLTPQDQDTLTETPEGWGQAGADLQPAQPLHHLR